MNSGLSKGTTAGVEVKGHTDRHKHFTISQRLEVYMMEIFM